MKDIRKKIETLQDWEFRNLCNNFARGQLTNEQKELIRKKCDYSN